MNVLLIEDRLADVDLILRALEKRGVSVNHRQVDNALDLEAALDARSWHVILSDFNLPGFGALEALSIIKRRELDVPFLIISGAIGEETAVELMRAGAEDYIAKSNLTRLGPAIDRGIREAATRRLEREARIKAERAIRGREQMLAVVTHDLKNPLGAIRLNIEMAQRINQKRGTEQSDHEKKLIQQLERIGRSVDRMYTLVNDVLDLAKIEEGKFSVEKTECSVDDLLADIIDQFEPYAAQKDIELSADLPEAEGNQGVFDRARIFQVLANLVSNALKFTPEGGKVTIQSRQVTGKWIFSIRDTGSGIAADQLPHIFDRFWQAHASSRQGTGLGLSIAKGIVTAHQGQIWAESEPLRGSAFHFSLPTESRRA